VAEGKGRECTGSRAAVNRKQGGRLASKELRRRLGLSGFPYNPIQEFHQLAGIILSATVIAEL
jgi:hypothetical protein